MVEPLCLFGAGEHARVVAEAAALAGHIVAGCWAPEPGPGLAYCGNDNLLEKEIQTWKQNCFHLAMVGPPRNGVRRKVLQRFSAHGLVWAVIVHPTAWVSPSARLGAGVFIGPCAVINAGAIIGDHAIINSGVMVEHDVVVGEGTHLAPAAICGGGVRIGTWAFCGLGCIIRDHRTVGDDAVIGMGSVVIDNVAPGTMAYGNPARPRDP